MYSATMTRLPCGHLTQLLLLLFSCVSLPSSCTSDQPPPAALDCSAAQHHFLYNSTNTTYLNDALKEAQHFNGSSVCIELYGTFTLQPEDLSSGSGALNLVYENVMIRGADSPIAVIKCDQSLDTGLGFTGSNITLTNLRILHCAALHNSTSKDTNTTTLLFRSALYFERVHSLTLSEVSVQSSPGVGVTLFNVAGKVDILGCHFEDSSFQVQADYPGGAGLYIEFTYCDPGVMDVNCAHPVGYNSYSDYTISGCIFSNNAAASDRTNTNFTKPQGLDHMAFGRGGGLSIFLKGNATGNNITITHCMFSGNSASWGGGLFIEFQDNTRYNNIVHNGGTVSYNNCYHPPNIYYQNSGTAGGGSRIGFIALDGNTVENNSVQVIYVNYFNNECMFGGGVAFYSAREPNQAKATNTISFTNCNWIHNSGLVGAAVNLHSWLPVTEGVLPTVVFDSCTFISNTGNYSSSDTNGYWGTGIVYVDSFPVQFYGNNSFDSNNGSALAAVVTGIDVKNDSVMTFTNNRGIRGGAVLLLGYAYLRVWWGAQLHFVNNSADLFGGAIYAQYVGNSIAVYYVDCFLRPADYYAPPEEWNFTVTFTNNCAGMRGNDIYTTSLIPCLWPYSTVNTKYLANSTKYLFRWKSFTYNPGVCESTMYSNSTISTDSDSFVYEKKERDFYPGQTLKVPISTTDDLGADFSTILLASIDHSEGDTGTNVTNWLTYSGKGGTIQLSANSTVNQTTTVIFHNMGQRLFKREVTYKQISCPLGRLYSRDSMMCECGDSPINGSGSSVIPYPGLIACSGDVLTVSAFWWAGNHSDRFAIGYCPVGYCDQSTAKLQHINTTNTRVSSSCMPGREGTLCGKCSLGYSPQVVAMGLVACVQCWWLPADAGGVVGGVVLFLLLEVVPLVLFCIFLLFTRLSITHGWLHSLVFYSQVLPPLLMSIDYQNMYPPIGVFYDIWQLNFLGNVKRYVCMFPTATNAFEVVAAEGSKPVVLLVTLLLALLLIRQPECCFSCLRGAWGRVRRGIRHCNNTLVNPDNPTVDGFVTILIICYGKFIQVSFTILSLQGIYTTDIDSDESHVVLMSRIQGSEEYLSSSHMPYAIAAIAVVVLLMTLPLLLFYNAVVPMCLRAVHLEKFFVDCQRIKPFLDSFYKGFKPHFRVFAAIYLVYRVVIWCIFAVTSDKLIQVAIFQLCLTSIMGIHCLVQPFQNQTHNWLETANLLLLTLINAMKLFSIFWTDSSNSQQGWDDAIRFSLVLLPALCLLVYLGWKVVRKCIRKFHGARRQGYDNMEASNSWEGQQPERHPDGLIDMEN